MSVNNVELTRPPITTTARGRCTSEPIPWDSARGTNPRSATKAVVNTGRRRNRQPLTTASSSSNRLPRAAY